MTSGASNGWNVQPADYPSANLAGPGRKRELDCRRRRHARRLAFAIVSVGEQPGAPETGDQCNDFNGNLTFDAGPIGTFASAMASAQANGWNVQPSEYASTTWSLLASTSPGRYTPSPGGLMEGAERAGVYGAGGKRTGIYGGGGLFD